MTLESGGGGGSYSGFQDRAKQRQNDLAAMVFDLNSYLDRPEPGFGGGGSFGKKKKKKSKANPDLAALLLGQKGVPAGDNVPFKNLNAGSLPVDYIDPNLQRLLDERNRKKKSTDQIKGADGAASPRISRGGGGGRNPRRRAIRKQEDDLTGFLKDYLAEKMATIGGTFDYESALRESEKAIKQAYKRDINAIRGSNRRARKDSAANRREVEALYRALSESYQDTAQESIENGQQLAEMMQAVTEGSQNTLSDLASQIQNEQASLAQGLGIEEAAESWMPEQAENTQEQLAAMAAEGSEDANRQLGFAGNQQRWLERGSQNALLEGTNQSAQLLRDLQDYIQGNRDKITDLRSMRGQELASNKSEIMAQVQDMQAQQDQALWDQLMQYSNLKLDIEDTQADNDLARRKLRFDIRDSNRDARQWAAEFGLKKDEAEWGRKMDAKELELALLKSSGMAGGSDAVPGYFQDFTEVLQSMNPRVQNIAQSIVNSDVFQKGIWYDKESKREFKLNPTSAAAEARRIAEEEFGIKDRTRLNQIALAAMVYAQGGV